MEVFNVSVLIHETGDLPAAVIDSIDIVHCVSGIRIRMVML